MEKDANGHWSKPENLGYPINSNGDELGIAIAADGKTAYFASERVGGAGGLDLYKFEMDAVNKPKYVLTLKAKFLMQIPKLHSKQMCKFLT